MRVRIKMCGVTRLQDALAAVAAGVDALGFIFYEKSPRCIDPEEARLICEQLPPFVDSVGVFVDKKRNEVEEIISYCRLSYAQLHGDESPKYCERLARFAAPCHVLKALRISADSTADTAREYNRVVDGFLLDTLHGERKGGTGEVFDWSVIDRLGLERSFILAGGLDCTNIGDALQRVRPFGVDVNSGVEKAPGVKDAELIRAFVRLVRQGEIELQRAMTKASR